MTALHWTIAIALYLGLMWAMCRFAFGPYERGMK